MSKNNKNWFDAKNVIIIFLLSVIIGIAFVFYEVKKTVADFGISTANSFIHAVGHDEDYFRNNSSQSANGGSYYESMDSKRIQDEYSHKAISSFYIDDTSLINLNEWMYLISPIVILHKNVLMNKIVQKQFDSIMYFIKNNRNVNFKIQVAHSINDKTMLY